MTEDHKSDDTGRGAADIVVARDGSGDYRSVQAAIDATPERSETETVVRIEPGVYREKLILPAKRTNVTFVGGGDGAVLTYDDHAAKTDRTGEEIGTTGSSTFFLHGDGFTARNITFENRADHVAQAVAIRVDADQAVFENCRFVGWQDTLYTHGEGTCQYYRDCYVEGRVDFIFGWATAYFEDCEIRCVGEKGYVTAASTPEGQAHGYVFENCDVVGDAPEGSFYLGRPWRPHAKTVFVNCYLGSHIAPEGWHNWHDESKEKTARYAEYGNRGPGAAPAERVGWAGQLTEEEAAEHTSLTAVFDGWEPRGRLEDE